VTEHIVAIHDDDWTSTAADIAAADFIDGESIVQTRDGQVPILRGIQGVIGALTAVNSVVYATGGLPRMTLMPSTWKETHKIFFENFLNTTPWQDGTTAGDFNDPLTNNLDLDAWEEGLDLQLTENMNWVNTGDSQLIGFNATAQNMTVLLHYQYGSVIPWNGKRHPLVVVRKTATADVTADVWSSVANELFTDDGLDPDAVYRPLWGYCYPEGALDSVVLAWRMTDVDHKTWIGGIGPGSNYCNYVKTWFTKDSMMCNGDTNFKFEVLADAACKPSVAIAFQEVSKGAEPRTVAPSAAPARAAGPSAGSLRLPGGLGGFSPFRGR
jgi:hypothetical protein